jgi:capsular polysaccharide transport system permease protein
MKSESPTTPLRSSFPRIMMRLLTVLYFIILAAAVAYVWLFAQDRFVSVSSYKISRQSPSGGDGGFGALALPGIVDTGSVDSQIAIGFVNSADLLLDLEKRHHLRRHYTAPPKDYFFRLEMDAPVEERLEFYRGRIFSHYDKETGLTMLTVDTFDPKLSLMIAEDVLAQTELFINALNHKVADQQLEFIRREMDRSEKNVGDIIGQLLELQNANNIITPDQAITARLRTVQDLKMKKITAETQLTSTERDSPESPRLEALRSQIRSLDQQIDVESGTLSGPDKDRLNQVLATYKELELKLAFATRLRTGSATMYEKNRMDAAAQSRFLSILQSPYLPEEAAYPRRSYATGSLIVLGILLFLTLRVMILSVYERTP